MIADIRNQVVCARLALRRLDQRKMNEVQVLIYVARALKKMEEILQEAEKSRPETPEYLKWQDFG